MIPYMLSAGIVLAVCLVFYKILLQKETFFRVNRYILLFFLVVSFGLPLVPVPQQWSLRKANLPAVSDASPSSTVKPLVTENAGEVQPNVMASKSQQSPATTSSFDIRQAAVWAGYLYWFGVMVFGLNFLVQLIVLCYRSLAKDVIRDKNIRIVEVTGDKAPCSFGNTIFINPSKYEWETYNQILMHEKLHIQQKHSLDLLMAEIMLVFQWFNPFAWRMRKEMETNLEFLTDHLMVNDQGVNKTSYQLSLLQVTAPNMPLSLTTNYNQSLLKKRITMMDAKKSNLHTIWKYFFLLPLLVLFACLLNQPTANSQPAETGKKENKVQKNTSPETEGSWFATIKGEKVSFQFKNDDNEHESFNSSSFQVSEFSNLPRGSAGTFTLTREAGTMSLTGKFDGDQGMGHYKFTGDKQYGSFMDKEINDKLDERDLMVFFFINIKKSYVQMLKEQGYTSVAKNELIPLAALNIDGAYIKSLKESGFKDLKIHDLIPFKSLGIDGSYIQDIRKAGFADISAQQLISFKAQKIDKTYLDKLNAANKANNTKATEMHAEDVVSYKALNIDDAFIKSFKDAGYNDLDKGDLTAMKSLGVTPEFANSFKSAGYELVPVENLISMKSMGVTAEYIKGLRELGYDKIRIEDVISVKSLGITADYARSFKTIGYDIIPIHDLIAFKAQHITPAFIQGFGELGFKNIPAQQIISLKAVGVTPEYIKSMKEKGLNYDNVEKYIRLKTID